MRIDPSLRLNFEFGELETEAELWIIVSDTPTIEEIEHATRDVTGYARELGITSLEFSKYDALIMSGDADNLKTELEKDYQYVIEFYNNGVVELYDDEKIDAFRNSVMDLLVGIEGLMLICHIITEL